MRRLRALFRPRSEDGTSLMEVVVATALIGILVPSILSTVDVFGDQTAATSDRLTAEADAQIAMDRLTKEIRAATPLEEGTGSPIVYPTTPTAFSAATSTSMTFYTTTGSLTPSKITVSLVPIGATGVDALRESVAPADTTSNPPQATFTGGATVRTDASFIVPASTSFSYADINGVANPTLANIEQVTIIITSQVKSRSPLVTLTATVNLENVDIAHATN